MVIFWLQYTCWNLKRYQSDFIEVYKTYSIYCTTIECGEIWWNHCNLYYETRFAIPPLRTCSRAAGRVDASRQTGWQVPGPVHPAHRTAYSMIVQTAYYRLTSTRASSSCTPYSIQRDCTNSLLQIDKYPGQFILHTVQHTAWLYQQSITDWQVPGPVHLAHRTAYSVIVLT